MHSTCQNVRVTLTQPLEISWSLRKTTVHVVDFAQIILEYIKPPSHYTFTLMACQKLEFPSMLPHQYWWTCITVQNLLGTALPHTTTMEFSNLPRAPIHFLGWTFRYPHDLAWLVAHKY